jgi:hypothetical protein
MTRMMDLLVLEIGEADPGTPEVEIRMDLTIRAVAAKPVAIQDLVTTS